MVGEKQMIINYFMSEARKQWEMKSGMVYIHAECAIYLMLFCIKMYVIKRNTWKSNKIMGKII